jgi:hypothetical protein
MGKLLERKIRQRAGGGVTNRALKTDQLSLMGRKAASAMRRWGAENTRTQHCGKLHRSVS